MVAKIIKNLKDYNKNSIFEIRSVVLEKFGFEKMAAARLGISMSNHSSDYWFDLIWIDLFYVIFMITFVIIKEKHNTE